MNDALAVHMGVANNDLFHIGDCLVFQDGFLFLDEFTQVASIAKLGYDISVVFGVVNIEHIDNVFGMFKSFENIDLGSQEVFMDFSFEHFHFDDFNCDFLVWL